MNLKSGKLSSHQFQQVHFIHTLKNKKTHIQRSSYHMLLEKWKWNLQHVTLTHHNGHHQKVNSRWNSEKGILPHSTENRGYWRHCGAQCGRSWKPWRCSYLMTQQSHIRATSRPDYCWRRHMCTTCSTVSKSQDMEETRMSRVRWEEKVDEVHFLKGMLKGIVLSHQKEENDSICRNIEGSSHDCIRWSKSDRRRQICNITDK